MHACVYACMCVSEGAVFGLQAPQRGPMCCYQPLGLWDWQHIGSRNKAVCSFPGRPVNKCLSQSPQPMGGEGKRGKVRV